MYKGVLKISAQDMKYMMSDTPNVVVIRRKKTQEKIDQKETKKNVVIRCKKSQEGVNNIVIHRNKKTEVIDSISPVRVESTSDMIDIDQIKAHVIDEDESDIEKLIEKREQLIKHHEQYKEEDYQFKLSTINNLLSNLRLKLEAKQCLEMQNTRTKIDKIVLEKKIPEKQFKEKINLTGDRDDKDPNTTLLTGSRQYFKGMTYLPIPLKLQEKDPKHDRLWGNKPMPVTLLKVINFS